MSNIFGRDVHQNMTLVYLYKRRLGLSLSVHNDSCFFTSYIKYLRDCRYEHITIA